MYLQSKPITDFLAKINSQRGFLDKHLTDALNYQFYFWQNLCHLRYKNDIESGICSILNISVRSNSFITPATNVA